LLAFSATIGDFAFRQIVCKAMGNADAYVESALRCSHDDRHIVIYQVCAKKKE
jgi:hypothetical protein